VPAVHEAAQAIGQDTIRQGPRSSGGQRCVARPKPNQGHLALERLCHGTNCRVVTQNVDGLHFQGVAKEERRQKLIEIHGDASTFKCAGHPNRPLNGFWDALLCPVLDAGNCPFGITDTVDRNLDVRIDESGFPQIDEVPMCPSCSALLMPAVLFFDEAYRDHDVYRWMECIQWMLSANTLVMVGTSNSVGITSTLLRAAYLQGMHVYDINTEPTNTDPIAAIDVRRIRGPSEQALPLLSAAVLDSS